MSIYDLTISALDGSPLPLNQLRGKPTLIVNVASRCGYTPQYAGLESLYEQYKDRGLTVLGVPCNQFGAQEPGSAEEIATFCSMNYGVTFPLTQKVEVNGPGRHALYAELTSKPDEEGKAGDVAWNFEKFLVSPQGDVVARFRSGVAPESSALTSAVESLLP